VTTAAGTSTTTRVFYAAPWLTAFTPATGIVGDTVTLGGTNFTDATAVHFGQASAEFTVDNTNRITAVVPTNATTGPVKVLAPGGAIVSTNQFHVLPHITGFFPVIGPAGTSVRILGTSFRNVSRVAFGEVAATTFANPSVTEVTAVVPNHPGRRFISVATPEGTAVSANTFLITAPSDLELTLGASSNVAQPDDAVQYVVEARNRGPAPVSQVRLTNSLPAGMVVESVAADRGTWAVANQVVTVDVGVLEESEAVTLTVSGRFASEGVFVNWARVTAFEADPVPSNNERTVSTVVVTDASRRLRIEAITGTPQVLISWPTSAVPFTLQTVPNLSLANAWIGLTNPPAVSQGRNRLTNPATGQSRFYRLSWP
jgi:uncharacterized repeat protein (TIGR01451 family)